MKFSNISVLAALLFNGVYSKELQQDAAAAPIQEPTKVQEEHNGLRGLGVCDPVGSCANNGDQYCCGSDASKYMTCTWDHPVTNPLREIVMPLAPGTKCCMTPFGNRITQVHLLEDCPPLVPPPKPCRAVIENGYIRLGIDDEGSLINCGSGLAYDQWGSGSNYEEVLNRGRLSEAFGVSAKLSGTGGNSFYGGASSSEGKTNLVTPTTPMTFTSASAKTTVKVSTGPLKVTHHFQPSPDTNNLYQITVTYKNTHPTKTLKNLRYRRVMDFDVAPIFDECMSFFYQGTFPQYLEYATNNGFLDVNPTNNVSGVTLSGFPTLPGPSGGIHDFGPRDQGALFNFQFQGVTIPPKGTFSFNIFYGAAADKTGANAAVNAVGATMGAFAFNPSPNSNSGQCSNSDGSGPGVFIFAFSPLPPPCALPPGGCMANGDQYCCAGDDSRFNVCTWDSSLNLSPIVMDVAPGTKCCQTPYGNRVTQQHHAFDCPV